ncbi:hydantoinase B/oxoprolinase family protein [Tsuneonella sp. YG55]|uniref:Hydantoinase B/oxoprolinase family protein n=1 Tax=Tsuneonella litorea TaxID=2976475 RepID=A0A9X3A857_9SPHN|nr:hydantoinase B/oxoprolinase family protein [Tsuneonella litorea]MCT2557520.1 hydantoinase B/oxoprolinase family protein [Tsuneonella litorea]
MTKPDPKAWSGKVHSYRPAADWKARVDDRLELHEDVAEVLDPTDYEVIRQKLWTINLAHGDTITRISGSPVLATLDFNMSILTEDADVVMNAPYIQFLNAGAPLGIRYIMENYSTAPGIDEGDIFCCNDPWIAACHQMDVLFAAPIFCEGKLFGWAANAGHQYDLGGIVPGGWPQNAEDVYSDPVVLPPFKLVEKGVMRRDLEALYLRQSRLPDMVALDLRAQLAGVRFAREQIVQLCGRFGAATVKAAMRQMVDQAQESFRKKLLSIPDGTWTETRYIDEPMPFSRTTQRTQLSVTKKGDRLTISNAGTDAQTPGTNGIPFVTWAGSITGIISVSMLYEQLFAYGGCERQIDYEATPGTLTCVDYPAAVSGGILHAVTMMNAMQAVLSRMMAASEELKGDIVAPCAEFMLPVLIGFNDRGEYFGQAILDGFACGSGARSFGDGVDTGGPNFSPLSMILNTEQLEQWYPILCLYRRSDPDSGGAGKWRGGNGLRLGITPYRAQSMDIVTNTGGQGATSQNGQGLLGGLPSPASHYVIRKGTELATLMAGKRLPQTAFDIAAEETLWLGPKSNGTPLSKGDIFEFRVGGGGGYGDPLDRDPQLVARDIELGAISPDAARNVYGFDPEDSNARSRLRESRGKWRKLETSDETRVLATGEPDLAIHEYVVATDRNGERVLACAKCGERLAGFSGSYKDGALVTEVAITTIPSAPDPARYIDDEMVLRLFACPGCLTQVSADIARAGEPVFEEMRLAAT